MSNTKKIVRILLIINLLQLIAGTFALAYILKVSSVKKDSFPLLVMAMLLITSLIILSGLYMAWRSNDNQYEETLRNLEGLNNTLRIQRHDYLNHFQVIYGLMELEEYEEAMRYLQPVYHAINKVGKVLKTSQPAVNALLQAKLQAAEAAGAEVFLEIHSDLKYLPMEAWNLCKILANIIDNAICAVEQEPSPRIKISISEEQNGYYFTIANNGPMIDREFQKIIYQPGVTTRKEEGHGMGLYIVNKIVQEAGGSIRLTSTPENTAFDIMLPKINEK